MSDNENAKYEKGKKMETTYGVSVRLPKDMKDKVDEAAWRVRMRMTPFMEEAILKEVKRVLAEVDPPRG